MADFSFLDKFNVKEDSRVEYPFYEIIGVDDKPVVLVVAAAGEPNKPYFAALTKWTMKNRRKLSGDFSVIEKTREYDRGLYAEHVIKGWKNVPDGNTGQAVPFSKAHCMDFLRALPSHMFDQLREFCVDPENFSGVSNQDVEDTSKN